MVDNIVEGAKLGEPPVERLTKSERVIILKTTRGLGLTTAQSLLLRAHEVLE